MAIKDFNRLDNMDLVTITQLFIGSFSHDRIHMNRIDCFTLRILIKNTSYGAEHTVYGLAQIFTSVGRDENQFPISDPVEFRMRVVFPDRMLHCVNNGIPGNVDTVGVLTLFQQVFRCQFRGSEVILADDSYRLTVELFRIRAINIISSQASLNMPNRNLQIEACQGRHESCTGITVDKNYLRFDFL